MKEIQQELQEILGSQEKSKWMLLISLLMMSKTRTQLITHG